MDTNENKPKCKNIAIKFPVSVHSVAASQTASILYKVTSYIVATNRYFTLLRSALK